MCVAVITFSNQNQTSEIVCNGRRAPITKFKDNSLRMPDAFGTAKNSLNVERRAVFVKPSNNKDRAPISKEIISDS